LDITGEFLEQMKIIANLLDLHVLVGIGTKLHFRFKTRDMLIAIGMKLQGQGIENPFLDVSTV
jgi:hypothetical protein